MATQKKAGKHTSNKVGGATSIIEYSPGREAAIRRTMARTEARWAAKAGPVTIRRVGDPVPPPTE